MVGGLLQLVTGATINEFSTDGTLVGNRDTAVPTEQAVKTYVDGFVGSGFPFNVLTVDLVDAQADYADLNTALAAASPGDFILMGPGTYTAAYSVPDGVHIIGHGPTTTIIQRTTGFKAIVLNGDHILSELGITFDSSTGGSTVEAIRHEGGAGPYTVQLFNCHVFSRNTDGGGSQDSYCILALPSVTAAIYGGRYESVGAGISKLSGNTVTAVLNNQPTVIFSDATMGPTAVTGSYFNGTGISIGNGSGASINEYSTDGTLAGNSDTALPTEQAVKTYVDAKTDLLTFIYTDVGNVGAGEDDLMTFSVPAATLSANGDVLEFEMAFSIAGAAVITKQVKVKFGATTVYDSTAIATVGGGTLVVKGTIVRTGATTQRCSVSCAVDVVGMTVVQYATPGETLSGAIILKATGEATNNDDIIQRTMWVKKTSV